MNEKRWLTVHFTDETELQFDFQAVDLDLTTLGDLVEKSVQSNKLILEVEGVLYVFPYSNIKYIRVSPCPDVLPDITIRGVEMAE